MSQQQKQHQPHHGAPKPHHCQQQQQQQQQHRQDETLKGADNFTASSKQVTPFSVTQINCDAKIPSNKGENVSLEERSEVRDANCNVMDDAGENLKTRTLKHDDARFTVNNAINDAASDARRETKYSYKEEPVNDAKVDEMSDTKGQGLINEKYVTKSDDLSVTPTISISLPIPMRKDDINVDDVFEAKTPTNDFDRVVMTLGSDDDDEDDSDNDDVKNDADHIRRELNRKRRHLRRSWFRKMSLVDVRTRSDPRFETSNPSTLSSTATLLADTGPLIPDYLDLVQGSML